MKTKQEEALEKAQKKYGDSAFTEDTLNYKRVGFLNPVTKRQVKAIGKTWAAAFKVADKHYKIIEKEKNGNTQVTEPAAA